MTKKPKKQPGFPILVQYARGNRDNLKFWSKFIESDPDSMAQVSLLQKLDRLFASTEIDRLCSQSKQLGSEIFERFRSARRRTGKRIAHLYFDSRTIPLPEGIRPSLMSERRLKFASGPCRIELSVVPVIPGRFDVTGRFEGNDAESRQSVFLRGRLSHSTHTDEFGFFSFAAVNPGTYTLRIGSGKQEVVIRDLVLR